MRPSRLLLSSPLSGWARTSAGTAAGPCPEERCRDRAKREGGSAVGEGKMRGQEVHSFKSHAALTFETNWGNVAFLRLSGLSVPIFPTGSIPPVNTGCRDGGSGAWSRVHGPRAWCGGHAQ